MWHTQKCLNGAEECNCSLYGGTCTTAKEEPLTMDVFSKAVRLIEGLPETPLYFYSNTLGDDDLYQMEPGQISIFPLFPIDNNTKTMYICGKNVRDTLIKEGVTFQNYKPEEEK